METSPVVYGPICCSEKVKGLSPLSRPKANKGSFSGLATRPPSSLLLFRSTQATLPSSHSELPTDTNLQTHQVWNFPGNCLFFCLPCVPSFSPQSDYKGGFEPLTSVSVVRRSSAEVYPVLLWWNMGDGVKLSG